MKISFVFTQLTAFSHRAMQSAAIASLYTLLWIAASSAHDLGSMQIECIFRNDGTYLTTVKVDREHLPAAIVEIKPDAFAAEFAAKSIFKFDEILDKPQLESIDSSADGEKFTAHFLGQIPKNATVFTFKNEMGAGDYFLRLKNEDDAAPLGYLLNDAVSFQPFTLKKSAPAPSTLTTVKQYVVLGFTHIVPKGLDHILFVLGLFLLSFKLKPILLQVTAFTVAHSITLGLSIYGLISLPSSVVEPLIALSIAYVAIENLLVREFKPWRTALVFAFGLLHGMGFAGVLEELGLPKSQFAAALVSFNAGVELGQLSVIAAAFLAVGLWFGNKPWYRARITVPASILIALTGLYWTAERIL